MSVGAQTAQFSIVVAGHGSRDPDGVREFEELVTLLRQRADGQPVEFGYLEFAKPTIREAVGNSIARGAKQVVVLPALLSAATHAKNDMPSELLALRAEFPDCDFHFGAAMDLHPLLLSLCRERIVDAESKSPRVVRRSETCLVVVGRGTSDSDANSDVSKLARMLEEGMGFGSSFVCYSGTAKPLVGDGLKTAARLGFQRIIVLPYMLFDGVLVKRIYAAADALAQRIPAIEVLKAEYLGVHPSIADVFIERAKEGVEGRAHMNCSLCKYRVQIVGYERHLGLPQMSAKAFSPGMASNGEQPVPAKWSAYEPHPIEKESFRIIEEGRDWSQFTGASKTIAQRLVHTSGDFSAPDDLFMSQGAADIGMKAILRCRRVITDVTMVESGIKRELLQKLGVTTWCGVHDQETKLMAESAGITRSAAGIRRAWQIFGNDLVLAVGDAPTAVMEAVRLIRDHAWRPQLVIGLPVGFVGTRECKDELRRCMQIPRITNNGTRGGSPWAASVINALMIEALNQLAEGA
jgi:precorrin-8X/cobalt-precorrin-8 methylmutase